MEKILKSLKSINRDTDKLIDFLKEKDFFEKPASINHHSNYSGGLAYHSQLVYEKFKALNEEFNAEIPEDTLIVSSILHDLCKIDDYSKEGSPPSKKQKKFLRHLIVNNGIDLSDVGELNKNKTSQLIDWLKNTPNEPMPDLKDEWGYNNSPEIPLKHAEKSIFYANRYIDLKERETLAIRYHMGAWENNLDKKNYNEAATKFPDIKLLAIADEKATFQEKWE